MPFINLNQIPGYAEARKMEQRNRDADFLGLTEDVGGFECAPLTLRHCLILRMMDSPLLDGRTPNPVELAAFLWLVSTDYSPQGGRARKRLLKRCRAFTPPALPMIQTKRGMLAWDARFNASMEHAAKVLLASRQYIQGAFTDAGQRGGNGVSYYSDAAGLCAAMAKECGWTTAQTLNAPLRQVFQFTRAIRHQNDPKAILGNPSDRIRGDFLDLLNSQRRENQ